MRALAHAVALIALASTQLCATPLLARPTRPIPREPARRVVAPPPAHNASHARAAHHASPLTGSHHASAPKSHGRQSTAASLPESRATLRPARHPIQPSTRSPRNTRAYSTETPPDPSTIRRVHAWEQAQRTAAAQAAIADADATASGNAPPTTKKPTPAAPQPLIADASNLVTTTPELPSIQSIEQEAFTPVLIPSLYDQRGHLVVPPPLYGSREVLLHQNQMADRDGLNRVQDDADLLDLRRDRKLVALPVSQNLVVDARLPANRRFSRPWTAQFLTVLAHDFYASFHEPLQVNSAVRTVQFQRRLVRSNGNAAPAAGETASPHLTGQAVDIAKRGLSLTQIAWMRSYLQPLIDQGKIDVEEEFQQSCFHISVYRKYLPAPPARVTVAATRPPQPTPSY